MNKNLQTKVVPAAKSTKIVKLILGLFFDAVGMISYAIPGFMEVLDIAWAPISGLLLAKMYKGNVGKAAGIIGFLEEIIPGTDVIPTFTLTWIYVYVIKKEH